MKTDPNEQQDDDATDPLGEVSESDDDAQAAESSKYDDEQE